jgi:DNA-directed RNA polymerase specialized sigma24 family protein
MMMVARESTVDERTDERLAELVRSAQAGSSEAFELLVQELGPLLYRFLYVRLGSEADAKDALQETLVVAWQRLRSINEPRALRAWLLTIARRKGREVERHRCGGGVVAELAWAAPAESGHDFEAALRGLSEERREVILLRYLVGLSEQETATALQISVGTVKSRAARARVQIESLLAGEADGGRDR